jgi:hypothetical protein
MTNSDIIKAFETLAEYFTEKSDQARQAIDRPDHSADDLENFLSLIVMSEALREEANRLKVDAATPTVSPVESRLGARRVDFHANTRAPRKPLRTAKTRLPAARIPTTA